MIAPLRLVWRGIKLLYRAALRFNDDDGAALAGYLAYTAILALFPFLIFATALTGHLIGEPGTAEAMSTVMSVLPDDVASTLRRPIREVLSRQSGGLLTISAAASVFVASNGVEAVRTAFERAYKVEKPMHFLLRRLVSAGLVLVGVVVFAALGLLIVIAPLAVQYTELFLRVLELPGGELTVNTVMQAVRVVEPYFDVARYIVGAALIWLFLWTLHRILPARPMVRMHLWPGILVSVVACTLIATGFSVYLSYAPSYTVTYGTLAGVIVTLLFLYLTGAAVIFGAEVNAEYNHPRRYVAPGKDTG